MIHISYCDKTKTQLERESREIRVESKLKKLLGVKRRSDVEEVMKNSKKFGTKVERVDRGGDIRFEKYFENVSSRRNSV